MNVTKRKYWIKKIHLLLMISIINITIKQLYVNNAPQMHKQNTQTNKHMSMYMLSKTRQYSAAKVSRNKSCPRC